MHNHPILIVDDDEDDRQSLLSAFVSIKKPGLVRFFISGCDLLKHIDTLALHQQPALLVLDYNMPRINGQEILKKIRAHSIHFQVPAIVYSTGFPVGIKQELEALNVLTCIQKGGCFDKIIEQASFFSELIADDVDTLLGIA